jgi:hypothetical protein
MLALFACSPLLLTLAPVTREAHMQRSLSPFLQALQPALLLAAFQWLLPERSDERPGMPSWMPGPFRMFVRGKTLQ